MSKEKDKILRTLEHIAITFDKLGYSPTIPIFKGHQDFEYLFRLELDTIKELCNQQDQRIAELEEFLHNREKWIVELEKQVNFSRAMERVALKGCKELEEQLKNALCPKFKVGDYFIEYWNKEPNIYQYQGNNHFKCLNKKQGYHCDYVILGALLLEEDFIEPISEEEAQAKLKELQGE